MAETLGNEGLILFYDGTCALCSRTVRWALAHDRRGVLRFAPLNGETHRRFGSPGAEEGGSTLILVKDGEVFLRSAGAVRLLRALGGVWRILGWVAWLVPLPLRDAGYRFIAARRHRWFGTTEACPVSGGPDRHRLLD